MIFYFGAVMLDDILNLGFEMTLVFLPMGV